MHDKASEHRQLFLSVTQVGYTVKKTEMYFFTLSINVSLSLSLSLSRKASVVSILSSIRARR